MSQQRNRFAVAALLLLLAIAGIQLTFGFLRDQQLTQTLQGIESILQDETTSGNSYTYARRLQSLEHLGLVVCARFTEITPAKRVFYDTTYRPGCATHELRSREMTSLDQARTWKIEAIVPDPPFMFAAKVALFTVLIFSFSAALFVLISIEKRRVKAESENVWLRDLTSQVKHDVASPLGALRIAAQFPNVNPRLKEFLELAIHRTSQIFEDLGRASLPLTNPAQSNFDLGRTIKNIVMEKNSPRIICEVSEGFAIGSELEFGRAISNLLNNGLESGRDSLVSIRMRARADCWEIVISDNGFGFPEEVLKGIYKHNTVGKTGGLGLGLFHAEELIKSMGGNLLISNNPAGGAKIEISLPSLRD